MINKDKNLYWIGPRLSDIVGIEKLFTGVITIYGNEESYLDNRSYSRRIKNRINHNNDSHSEEISNFFNTELNNIINNDKNSQFLFYNSITSYSLDKEILDRTIGLNHPYVINFLADKLRTRLTLANSIPVLSTTLKFSFDCDYKNLKCLFPDADEFVLQETLRAYGGFGTHILNKQNENTILKQINCNDCIVSPYISNSIPINQHIVVYKKEIVLFPPSVQIIQRIDNKLQYCGGDFAAINDLSEEVKAKLNSTSKIIGEIIGKLGYRGVLGIDYILKPNKELLFIEINGRFQASTYVINQELITQKIPSIHEYHLESFYKDQPDKKQTLLNINYSTISYINDRTGFGKKLYKNIIDEPQLKLRIIEDGYVLNDLVEEGAYMFRLLLKTNITSCNFDNIADIHPNIIHEPTEIGLYRKNSEYILKLKINLLVKGIRIGESFKSYKENSKFDLKEAVGSALDIVIDNYLYINTPLNVKFSSLSPFSIEWNESKGLFLSYSEEYVTEISITEKDSLMNKRTINGVRYYDIAQFFTDRLRIHPFPNCSNNKYNDKACKFCDLGYCDITKDYSLLDIFEVIENYDKSDLPIKHFLIGGGCSNDDKSWSFIINIVQFIRKRSDKSIYLMVTPPNDLDILNKLKIAGITEIGFNIELFNRKLAQKFMPSKGKIPIEHYFKCFKRSTEIWGKSGNVRSILIIGLEAETDTLMGVQTLCEYGVMPILSVFRPLPNTPLSDKVPPSPDSIIRIWKKSLEICKEYGLIPGPLCVPCQNNTVSIPIEYCKLI